MTKTDNQVESESEKLSRWPGVVLSLFVPGFGLLRADRPKRFLAWFIGLLFLASVASLALTWRALPNWSIFVIPALALVPAIVMWRDSCRPGKMTKKRVPVFGHRMTVS